MKTASWWLSLVAFGMTFLLCFCGASGGSTLFTLGKPHLIEIPSCLFFVWVWAFHSLVALCTSTLWYKNLISGLRSCENQSPLGWLIVELLQLDEEI
jgi:hypothetical protein